MAASLTEFGADERLWLNLFEDFPFKRLLLDEEEEEDEPNVLGASEFLAAATADATAAEATADERDATIELGAEVAALLAAWTLEVAELAPSDFADGSALGMELRDEIAAFAALSMIVATNPGEELLCGCGCCGCCSCVCVCELAAEL